MLKNTHGNRTLRDETNRFGSPPTQQQLRRPYHHQQNTPRHRSGSSSGSDPLSAAFSRLTVHPEYCSSSSDAWNYHTDGAVSHYPFVWDGACLPYSPIAWPQETEQAFLGDRLRPNSNGLVSFSNNSNVVASANETTTVQPPANQLRYCPGAKGNQRFDGSSLRDLRVSIVALAKDQYGCRYLQAIMGGLPKEEIEMIFLEVIDSLNELMIDPFGNFVVQKLVELCSEEQRTRILLMLAQVDFQLVRICLNVHGTRAVLKLLENLTTPSQISLVVAALSPATVALTKDTNGHYVIQYCVKHFSPQVIKYILNEVADNCYGIATDKNGCCVLQHCVKKAEGAQRDRLVAEIIENALLLAEDCYGNYVVQHLLELRVPQVTASLVRQLEGHYIPISCNKYGSNVVEKCLESGEQHSIRIIVELLRSPNISMLLIDPYGNYVIQSALSVSKGFIFDALRDLIRMNSPIMRSNIFGKKVLAWFEKRRLPYV